jgi:hypothetical protein
MAKPRKRPPVDRATPVLHQPKKTDHEKVSTTRTMTKVMQSASEWPSAPGVQQAVGVWNQDADALEANGKTVADLRTALRTAEGRQRALRRNWLASTRQVTASVSVFANGLIDRVHAFNFDVQGRTAPAPLPAPDPPTTEQTREYGEILVSWSKGSAKNGFVIQHASDPKDATTYSPYVPCTKPSFALRGLSPKAQVHFRIAAIDPTSDIGIGPWSNWSLGSAR